ncbi:MAG: nucleotidyltransferase family protein [Saprospiraceae bacterium]
MINQAIILAGGFGTRLKSVVADVPKPMAPVCERPFLAFIMDYLAKANFEKVVLSIGYKGEVVQAYFGDSYKGIRVEYATEATPLGTGGGILNATTTCSNAPILVLNGDTFFDVPISDFYTFFDNNQSDLAFALKPMTNFERYGTVVLDEKERITQFQEKQYRTSGLINGGAYILRKSIFENQGFSIGQKFSFEADFLEKYVDNLKFSGFVVDEYFIDIGIPEDYAKAQIDFLSIENG